MKFLLIITILLVSTLIGTSCKKQETANLPKSPAVQRTIQFILYTDKDFSNDQHNISFNLFIQTLKNEILWDSTLAPMKVKDIPGEANKIVIQKSLLDKDNSLLKVGFRYAIENVGNSWYFDSSSAGQTFTIVDFNFQ